MPNQIQKKRFNLIQTKYQREASTTKDQILKNVIVEYVKQPDSGESDNTLTYVMTRPGLSVYAEPALASGEGRGIYSWKNNYYSVIGTEVYKDTTSIKTLTTSTGRVSFVEMQQGSTKYLCLFDGTKGYYINTGGTVTEITDAQFPTPHIAAGVYMDGYMFVMKGEQIYNCDLEDIVNWQGTSFITPEIYPDDQVTISKHLNQIVAFGTRTIEFFYDAGNTGSPLQRTENLVSEIGCASEVSVDSAEGIICFIAKGTKGTPYIGRINNYTVEKLSTESIDRLLQNEGTSISTCIGRFARSCGHLLYLLDITNMTLVYDFNTELWYQWTTSSSTFSGRYFTEHNGLCLSVGKSDGKIYKLNQGVYQDNATNISVDIYTRAFDFGQSTKKLMSSLQLFADVPSSSVNLTLSYFDDDNYSTEKGTTTLDLTKDLKVSRLGSFRRRSFRFQFSSNAYLRLGLAEATLTYTNI